MISGTIIGQIFGLSSMKRKFLSFFNLFIASLCLSSLANGQNLEDGLVLGIPLMEMPLICREMGTMER